MILLTSPVVCGILCVGANGMITQPKSSSGLAFSDLIFAHAKKRSGISARKGAVKGVENRAERSRIMFVVDGVLYLRQTLTLAETVLHTGLLIAARRIFGGAAVIEWRMMYCVLCCELRCPATRPELVSKPLENIATEVRAALEAYYIATRLSAGTTRAVCPTCLDIIREKSPSAL
jgi:hypothetical protein